MVPVCHPLAALARRPLMLEGAMTDGRGDAPRPGRARTSAFDGSIASRVHIPSVFGPGALGHARPVGEHGLHGPALARVSGTLRGLP
jgi:hypothetical protein